MPYFGGGGYVGSSASFLLDTLSVSPTIAYSTRKLRAAYAGNALTARNASNATQTIGFNGSNDLDSTALTTFAAGTAVGSSIWNDQSGNGNDATAVSTGTVFVALLTDSSGNPLTQNGHVWHVGQTNLSSYNLPAITFSGTTGFTVVAVEALPVGGNSASQTVAGTNIAVKFGSGQWVATQTANISGGTSDNSAHCVISIFHGASSSIIVDGSSVASGDTGASTASSIVLWNANGNTNVAELLIFASVLSGGDQTLIKNSCQTYWGTP